MAIVELDAVSWVCAILLNCVLLYGSVVIVPLIVNAILDVATMTNVMIWMSVSICQDGSLLSL